ncbi:MAG: prolipoprotein diacylglyceryl transferase, partial [Cryomorphaceae bacterium]|nr:prolipoprotein diacylglyceryl transferase [Cryomorphaceae bacterium]
MLLTITWAAERGLELGPLFLRYYQVLFFAGFLLGFYLMRRYFTKEGVSAEVLDNLLIYTVVATIIGARLGHVFFYDWAYYKQHVA